MSELRRDDTAFECRKPDTAPLSFRWVHQFPNCRQNSGDCVIAGRKLSLQTVKLAR